MNAISSSRYYRPELDALRSVAFVMVFLFHSAASVGGPAVLKGGAFGVDLFFLLSAYLLTELFRRERSSTGAIDVAAFYWRRILRIWPLYFGFIAVVLAASPIVPQIQMPWAAVLALTCFGANWYLTVMPFFSPAGILWSVSIEEQFYVLIPWAMRYFSKSVMIFIVANLFLTSVGSRAAISFIGHDSSFLWYATVTRLDPIAIGTILALGFDGRVPMFGPYLRLFMAGCGAMILAGIGALGGSEGGQGVYLLADAAVILLFLSVLGAHIAWRFPIYLGRISYGLYVVHLLVLDVAKAGLLHVIGSSPWWMRAAVSFPVTIVVAAACYRWLETPFLRLRHRRPFAHWNGKRSDMETIKLTR